MSELERCCDCDEPTDRSGESEDSRYSPSGVGPFCDSCWNDGEAIDTRQTRIAALESERDAALQRLVHEEGTNARLIAENKRMATLEAENAELRKALEWCSQQVWDGSDIDGGDFQDEMERRGLLVIVPASPEVMAEFDSDEMFAWKWNAAREGQRR